MKNKIFFRISLVLIMVITFSAISIGFYEIFLDKSEASMYNCDWNACQGILGQDCSDVNASIHCTCLGGTLNLCSPFSPIQ